MQRRLMIPGLEEDTTEDLGLVRAPDGFTTSPSPVFRGDQVWAVVRDELDVQYIVRFRITRG